jgi:glycosidase
MLAIRNQHKTFGRGSLEFISSLNDNNGEILAFYRNFENEKWLIIHNMSPAETSITLPAEIATVPDIFTGKTTSVLPPYGFSWVKCN